MATIFQLKNTVTTTTRPAIKKKTRVRRLQKCPQKRGICFRLFIMTPKKPNSAKRRVAKIKLSTKKFVFGYIPGEGNNLQKFSNVLIRGGLIRDLPGVHYTIIRGKLDLHSIVYRRQGRSKYGTKFWWKPRKRERLGAKHLFKKTMALKIQKRLTVRWLKTFRQQANLLAREKTSFFRVTYFCQSQQLLYKNRVLKKAKLKRGMFRIYVHIITPYFFAMPIRWLTVRKRVLVHYLWGRTFSLFSPYWYKPPFYLYERNKKLLKSQKNSRVLAKAAVLKTARKPAAYRDNIIFPGRHTLKTKRVLLSAFQPLLIKKGTRIKFALKKNKQYSFFFTKDFWQNSQPKESKQNRVQKTLQYWSHFLKLNLGTIADLTINRNTQRISFCLPQGYDKKQTLLRLAAVRKKSTFRIRQVSSLQDSEYLKKQLFRFYVAWYKQKITYSINKTFIGKNRFSRFLLYRQTLTIKKNGLKKLRKLIKPYLGQLWKKSVNLLITKKTKKELTSSLRKPHQKLEVWLNLFKHKFQYFVKFQKKRARRHQVIRLMFLQRHNSLAYKAKHHSIYTTRFGIRKFQRLNQKLQQKVAIPVKMPMKKNVNIKSEKYNNAKIRGSMKLPRAEQAALGFEKQQKQENPMPMKLTRNQIAEIKFMARQKQLSKPKVKLTRNQIAEIKFMERKKQRLQKQQELATKKIAELEFDTLPKQTSITPVKLTRNQKAAIAHEKRNQQLRKDRNQQAEEAYYSAEKAKCDAQRRKERNQKAADDFWKRANKAKQSPEHLQGLLNLRPVGGSQKLLFKSPTRFFSMMPVLKSPNLTKKRGASVQRPLLQRKKIGARSRLKYIFLLGGFRSKKKIFQGKYFKIIKSMFSKKLQISKLFHRRLVRWYPLYFSVNTFGGVIDFGKKQAAYSLPFFSFFYFLLVWVFNKKVKNLKAGIWCKALIHVPLNRQRTHVLSVKFKRHQEYKRRHTADTFFQSEFFQKFLNNLFSQGRKNKTLTQVMLMQAAIKSTTGVPLYAMLILFLQDYRLYVQLQPFLRAGRILHIPTIIPFLRQLVQTLKLLKQSIFLRKELKYSEKIFAELSDIIINRRGHFFQKTSKIYELADNSQPNIHYRWTRTL